MVLKDSLKRQSHGSISPKDDDEIKVGPYEFSTVPIPKTIDQNKEPQKSVSRASIRRKARKLLREQQELLAGKNQASTLTAEQLQKSFEGSYKDPILFGRKDSTVPPEITRMATLSTHLLKSQKPEQDIPAPQVIPVVKQDESGRQVLAQQIIVTPPPVSENQSSLFTKPVQQQEPHPSLNVEQEPMDVGVEKLQEWDPTVPLPSVQSKEDRINAVSTGLVPEQHKDSVSESNITEEKEPGSPVLLGLEKLEREGKLGRDTKNKTSSTVTEFDANSLPDESSLKEIAKEIINPQAELSQTQTVSTAPESAIDRTPVGVDSQKLVPRTQVVQEPQEADTVPTHIKHSSAIPKDQIQQTYRSKNIIPVDSPTYITNVAAKLNMEFKEWPNPTLYLDKKIKKRQHLWGLLSPRKKLNDQLFTFRDNGHIESSVNPDYVLSCLIPDTGIQDNSVIPVFMGKKKALTNVVDDKLSQRWIVQESINNRKHRYIACSRDTQMVLDKEINGFRLVLCKKGDQNALQQRWSFKTYQSL